MRVEASKRPRPRTLTRALSVGVLASAALAGCHSTTARDPASSEQRTTGSQSFDGPFPDEDGYDLWLRYRRVADPARLSEYEAAVKALVLLQHSPTFAAAGAELQRGFTGLLGAPVPEATAVDT